MCDSGTHRSGPSPLCPVVDDVVGPGVHAVANRINAKSIRMTPKLTRAQPARFRRFASSTNMTSPHAGPSPTRAHTQSSPSSSSSSPTDPPPPDDPDDAPLLAAADDAALAPDELALAPDPFVLEAL